MTVKEIYAQLNITSSLQQHMLHVASLASLIMEGWKDEFSIDKPAVTQACLFHDIAKIISFKTFKDGEEKLQQDFIAKWGNDEHVAANNIVAEIGLLPHAQELIRKNNVKPFLEKIRAIMQSEDYEMKLLKYADSRIAPHGLVTLADRWQDLIARRSEKESDVEAKEIMETIENQLQKQTTLLLNNVSESMIKSKVASLAKLTV